MGRKNKTIIPCRLMVLSGQRRHFCPPYTSLLFASRPFSFIYFLFPFIYLFFLPLCCWVLSFFLFSLSPFLFLLPAAHGRLSQSISATKVNLPLYRNSNGCVRNSTTSDVFLPLLDATLKERGTKKKEISFFILYFHLEFTRS